MARRQTAGTRQLSVEIDEDLRAWLDTQKEAEQRTTRVIVERALRNERERIAAEEKEAKKKGKRGDD